MYNSKCSRDFRFKTAVFPVTYYDKKKYRLTDKIKGEILSQYIINCRVCCRGTLSKWKKFTSYQTE